jgi:hypothetical protein
MVALIGRIETTSLTRMHPMPTRPGTKKAGQTPGLLGVAGKKNAAPMLSKTIGRTMARPSHTRALGVVPKPTGDGTRRVPRREVARRATPYANGAATSTTIGIIMAGCPISTELRIDAR